MRSRAGIGFGRMAIVLFVLGGGIVAAVDFRGDIGGFGASSNLVWGIASGFRVWLPWHPFETEPYLAAGYRVVAFDRSNTDEQIDLEYRGPTIGIGFTY